MEKDLKYVVKIFHKNRLLAQETSDCNDDVLDLKRERMLYMSDQVMKLAQRALKSAIKAHDEEVIAKQSYEGSPTPTED